MLPFLLAAAGAGLSIAGSLQKSKLDEATAMYNARVAGQNATIARQQGEADVLQSERFSYLRQSASRAAYGASGLTIEGSPMDVLESSASQAELEKQNIRYSAELKALGFSNTAALDRSRAKTARKSALFNAAAAGLMGGARAYSMMPGTGTPLTVNSGAGEDFGLTGNE